MRIESAVTSVSWIPSENIPGLMRLPFELGPAHYDDPPGDTLPDLAELAASSRIRFANELRAWMEVEGDQVVGFGHAGRGWMGVTRLGIGRRSLAFPGVALPDLRPQPVEQEGSMRFVQTTGGRVAFPLPRRVGRAPFVQITAPLVWTPLALTLRMDGSSTADLEGASPFPRHWIYDHEGKLVRKSGLADFRSWTQQSFGQHTPWGSEDSPAVVTQVETGLERELSQQIMRSGRRPQIRTLEPGTILVQQGEPGRELFLLLDGVLAIEVGGEAVAEVGPGAMVGERAIIEAGLRTATLRAVTRCKVAVAAADELAPEALAKVAEGHRREERSSR